MPAHADGIMTPKPTGVPRSALPSGFQPDAHDELLQAYADVGAKYAPLWTKYGAGNITERQIKSLMAAVAVEIRANAATAGTKITESAIADQAYADRRVKALLDATEDGRMAFQQADVELSLIQERLRHLDATIRRGL
jgi:hypothetical protein